MRIKAKQAIESSLSQWEFDDDGVPKIRPEVIRVRRGEQIDVHDRHGARLVQLNYAEEVK